MMKVLVVGGAGYLGSITAQELLSQGYEVVVYDNLSNGHRPAVPEGAAFIHSDVGYRSRLLTAFQEHGFDAVLHFAGLIVNGESMRDPVRYYANNVAGTINLLGIMLECGVKQFVFSSSAAVYGNPDALPIDETAPLRPTSPYGETKAAVERFLPWLEASAGLRYASLRYFNAAGATKERGEDHRSETHLIPLALQVASGQRDHLIIHGVNYPTEDGTCVRDYLHVVDLARAHILALKSLEQGSGAYNLGSERGYSVRQVIGMVEEVTSVPVPVRDGPPRPGDPASLVASSSRAQEQLGWKREHSGLREIIQSAWEWQKRNPQGYQTA